MPRSLVTEIRLRCPVDEAFALVANADRIQALTPPWMSVRILPPVPGTLETGTVLDYALRLRGWPFRWRTEITCWDPPRRFAERQARGPFLSWTMRHDFEPADGGTLLRETMEYSVPGGGLVARIVDPEVERILAFRAVRLRDGA